MRKDDNWQLSHGVYMFGGMSLFLLLGTISAVIATINPWMVGEAFLLFLLLLVLAVGVIHHTYRDVFNLPDEPFVGASVGYFSVLFLLAGRALTVLLSPPVVVYSPRVLPVYVYDAHADLAKNVSGALLVRFGIALAVGMGCCCKPRNIPPFAGTAVSAITLVVAFGFAVSRPCFTMKIMDDAVSFLSKETVIQAIARSSTKASET